MKRQYKVQAAIGLFFLAFGLFAWLQPNSSYGIHKVHPRLSNLQQPYQSVSTAYIPSFDRSSVIVRIVDRNGRAEEFHFVGESNKQLFVGGYPFSNPNTAEKIAEPEHTKRMLICVLEEYPNRTRHDDILLASLRRHCWDYIKCLYYRWL
jgi:hypothetical protein